MMKVKMYNMETPSKEETDTAIYNLLFTNKIFAKCPACNNYMCFFEVYNSHCGKCGKIPFDKIVLLSLE